MKPSKKQLIVPLLLLGCAAIHWYSGNAARVEEGYSSHFSPAFSGFLRSLFGKLPFSIGDFLYGFFIAWLIYRVFTGIRFLFNRKESLKNRGLVAGRQLLIFCGAVYFIFNLFWGINYNRKGIAWQMGLTLAPYEAADLKAINEALVVKANAAKIAWQETKSGYPSRAQLFVMVDSAYAHASRSYPFLTYQPRSLKSSMWGWLGNYTGFTGYYNPFSGEAQVNTTVPDFLQPYISCHEVAHQLGYAKEREANFVGYLASIASPEPLLQYSAYLDLFLHANRQLYVLDSVAAKQIRKELNVPIQAYIKEWITFSRKHQNKIAPLINWMYGKYLQGNQQPQGILSYDEVTALLIAYYKKMGRV